MSFARAKGGEDNTCGRGCSNPKVIVCIRVRSITSATRTTTAMLEVKVTTMTLATIATTKADEDEKFGDAGEDDEDDDDQNDYETNLRDARRRTALKHDVRKLQSGLRELCARRIGVVRTSWVLV